LIFPSFRRFCLVDLTSPTNKDALPFYRREDMMKMMAKHGMAWGIPSWRGNGDFVCVFLVISRTIHNWINKINPIFAGANL